MVINLLSKKHLYFISLWRGASSKALFFQCDSIIIVVNIDYFQPLMMIP